MSAVIAIILFSAGLLMLIGGGMGLLLVRQRRLIATAAIGAVLIVLSFLLP